MYSTLILKLSATLKIMCADKISRFCSRKLHTRVSSAAPNFNKPQRVHPQSTCIPRVPQCLSPRRIGTRYPLSRKKVCPPTSLRVWGGGGPNSDDWRKSLVLCLLLGTLVHIVCKKQEAEMLIPRRIKTDSAGIFKQSMGGGDRNRVGLGFSYRTQAGGIDSLESILGLLKI
jgi:hypothetical protein